MPYSKEDIKARRFYKISERLKYLRKHFAYSQRKLADKIGVSQTHISLIENGNCTINDVLRIAEVFRVRPERLIDHAGETATQIHTRLFRKRHNKGTLLEEDAIPVGKKLRQLRIDNGLTQYDIADFLDIAQQTVYTMENGIALRTRYVEELASYYGVTIQWLLPNWEYYFEEA